MYKMLELETPRRCAHRCRKIAWCTLLGRFCDAPSEYEACPHYNPKKRRVFHGKKANGHVQRLRTEVSRLWKIQLDGDKGRNQNPLPRVLPRIQTGGGAEEVSLFPCPRCNAPITEDEYIGASPELDARFYRCKNCGEIIKKPIEKKVKT